VISAYDCSLPFGAGARRVGLEQARLSVSVKAGDQGSHAIRAILILQKRNTARLLFACAFAARRKGTGL